MLHAELLNRHRQVIPSWIALYYAEPIELVRGDGRTVWDAEGNEYLDFFGGILTTMTGYSVPEIVEAVQKQAASMVHTSTLYMIRPMVDLAEKIAALLPMPDTKVFFTNSGTEANDAALMLATGFRQSNQVIAVRGSYHGRSHSAVAITGHRSWAPTDNSPFNVHYLQSPQSLRGLLGSASEGQIIDAIVADLRSMLETVSRGDIACLIAEPIQGVGGFVQLPDGLLAALKKELETQGILLISDEVQTGWGRTGQHFWGFEAQGVVPDMVTFAKGLGNGLAIGGVAGRADVMDSMKGLSISTFGGNPLATAGALANLDYILSHDCQANSLARGTELRAGADALAERFSEISEIRGRGLMLAIEFGRADGAPDPETATQVMEAARRHGLLVGKGGLHANALRIAPPLTVTAEEIAEGAGRLEAAIEDVCGGA